MPPIFVYDLHIESVILAVFSFSQQFFDVKTENKPAGARFSLRFDFMEKFHGEFSGCSAFYFGCQRIRPDSYVDVGL